MTPGHDVVVPRRRPRPLYNNTADTGQAEETGYMKAVHRMRAAAPIAAPVAREYVEFGSRVGGRERMLETSRTRG